MFGLKPMEMVAIAGLGTMEMVAIAVIILFFFGAKRIPEMAKGVADGLKIFKKSMKEDDKDLKDLPK